MMVVGSGEQENSVTSTTNFKTCIFTILSDDNNIYITNTLIYLINKYSFIRYLRVNREDLVKLVLILQKKCGFLVSVLVIRSGDILMILRTFLHY